MSVDRYNVNRTLMTIFKEKACVFGLSTGSVLFLLFIFLNSFSI